MCLIVMFSPSIILKGKQNDCVNVCFNLKPALCIQIVTCAKITFAAIAYPHPPKKNSCRRLAFPPPRKNPAEVVDEKKLSTS